MLGSRSLLKTVAAGLVALGMAGTASATTAPLSVLTYNVEGLPWPVRLGRDADLERMSQRLRALRADGRQPKVVVLQEAFTPAAKRMPVDAGYRYVADGPGAADRGGDASSPGDRAFAASASALVGERAGKWADSGLRIASDYPILQVRRMPFPAFACAGFDCLANKGVLAVTLAVPGADSPVAVVATHLNSRRAAHVPVARSLYAYRRQVDAVRTFLRDAVPADLPMVFAGDFNVGPRPDRRGYLMRSVAGWRGRDTVEAAMDACLAARDCRTDHPADLALSRERSRDWQFFAAGRRTALAVDGLSVPFGRDEAGRMLSDHVGYTAHYRLSPRSARDRGNRA